MIITPDQIIGNILRGETDKILGRDATDKLGYVSGDGDVRPDDFRIIYGGFPMETDSIHRPNKPNIDKVIKILQTAGRGSESAVSLDTPMIQVVVRGSRNVGEINDGQQMAQKIKNKLTGYAVQNIMSDETAKSLGFWSLQVVNKADITYAGRDEVNRYIYMAYYEPIYQPYDSGNRPNF